MSTYDGTIRDEAAFYFQKVGLRAPPGSLFSSATEILRPLQKPEAKAQKSRDLWVGSVRLVSTRAPVVLELIIMAQLLWGSSWLRLVNS